MIKADILKRLNALGIAFERFDHHPIFTVEEGRDIAKRTGALCCKNLLLRDKRHFYLVVMPSTTPLDLKKLPSLIGSKRLSFASSEDLSRLLKTYAGAVSPLGLFFDADNEVQLVLDEAILKATYIDCHPCENACSLKIAVADIIDKLLPALAHPPIYIKIAPADAAANP